MRFGLAWATLIAAPQAIAAARPQTLAELAETVGGKVVGDDSLRIQGLSSISEAEEGCITFLANSKYRGQLLSTRASAVIAAQLTEGLPIAHLITPDPYVAYAKIAQLFFQKPYTPRGISKEALISRTARIGKDSSISPLV